MKQFGKWLLIAVGVLILLIAGVSVAGLFLPEAHLASRTLKTKQTPEAIWEAVTNHAAEPEWRKDLKVVDHLPDRNGHPLWREVYPDGETLTLETVESDAPRRLVREIADEGGPFSGRWEFAITPDGSGSRLTITEVGRVPNPFFRFMSTYVIGHATYLEKYLTALAGKFGEQPRIE